MRQSAGRAASLTRELPACEEALTVSMCSIGIRCASSPTLALRQASVAERDRSRCRLGTRRGR
jgi:hypothetical protein